MLASTSVQQLFGVVVIGVRTCASFWRLKSIVGCCRNTRIGKFPALQCIWKHIANSTVQPKYPELKGSISRCLGFSTVVLPFISNLRYVNSNCTLSVPVHTLSFQIGLMSNRFIHRHFKLVICHFKFIHSHFKAVISHFKFAVSC